MTMRAGLYARVSREEQAEGYSIDAQLEAMRQFCKAKDWTIANEYIEPGASGTTQDRPAFQELLEDCEAGNLDVLLTHQLDRFYRNLKLQLDTLGKLGEWNVAYVSVTEQIDYSTPQGMLFLSMLGAFNEYYVANLQREIRKGKRGRAKSGLPNNARLVQGYKRVEGKIIVDPNEAAAVRFMFEQYSTGQYTLQALTSLMNQQFSKKTRWTLKMIRHGLSNPFYIGQVRYYEDLYPGQHEAIIDEDLWQQVQQVRAHRTHNRVGKTKHFSLLSSLVRCHICGQPLRSEVHPPSAYFFCPAKVKQLECTNGGLYILQGDIEEQVTALVKSLAIPEDWREQLVELANHVAERNQVDRERKNLRAKLRRLRELYVEEGDFSKGEYNQRKTQIQAQLAALVVPQTPQLEEAAATLQTIADVWDTANPEDQRQFLRTMFQTIYVGVASGEVLAVVPHPQYARLLGMEE